MNVKITHGILISDMQYTAATNTVVFDSTNLEIHFATPPGAAPEGQKYYTGTYVTTENTTKMPCTLVAQVQCDTLHAGTDCVLPKSLHIQDYAPPATGILAGLFGAGSKDTLVPLKPTAIKPESVANIVACFPALRRHICVSMDEKWWFCATQGVPTYSQNTITRNDDTAQLTFAVQSPRTFRLPVHGLLGNPGLLTLSNDTNDCPTYNLCILWPFDPVYTQTLVEKMRRFVQFGHMYPYDFKCNGVRLICVSDDPVGVIRGVYDGSGEYMVYVVHSDSKDPKGFEDINLLRFEQDHGGTNLYGMIAVRTKCSDAMRPVRPTTAIGRAPPVATGSTNCPGPCISIGGRSVTYSGPLTRNTPHHGA